MSQMIQIDLRPSVDTLRSFGWIALVAFNVLAGLAWLEWAIFAFGLGESRPIVAGVLSGIGILAGLTSLVWPRGNRALFVVLSLVAFPIGFVLSYVILGGIFFVLIAPTGLVMRLLGRDPMQRAFDRAAPTYWVDAPQQRPRESYFRQY